MPEQQIKLTPEADAWLRGHYQVRPCEGTDSFDVWAVCTGCGVRVPVARMAVMRRLKHGVPIPCTHCRDGRLVPQKRPSARQKALTDREWFKW